MLARLVVNDRAGGGRALRGRCASSAAAGGDGNIRGSPTYRAEVVGRVGVVAAGRHFAAEAGMRMLARGGERHRRGRGGDVRRRRDRRSRTSALGGEVPLILHLAERNQTVVVNGQGVAPAAASAEHFRREGSIPTNGPSAGTVPAVVDALTIALAEYGTLTLADVLTPAIELADGFPWYAFLTHYLTPQLDAVKRFPSGARVYLQGPDGTIPPVGSVFRQPDLARTLRALIEEERRHAGAGRKSAIYAARDRFYRGDIGQRIAASVRAAGGLLTIEDLAGYRGRVEAPTRVVFKSTTRVLRGPEDRLLGARVRSCSRRSSSCRTSTSRAWGTTPPPTSTP